MTCTAIQTYTPSDSVFHLFPPPGYALPEWHGMTVQDIDFSYEQTRRALMRWRNTELKDILVQRDGRCWMPDCDGHSLSSMHEAVRRGHVMGWQPKMRRLAIYNGLNTVILCDKCHGTAREPAKEEVADFMADTYGLDVYLDWLLSLTFKSAHPLAGWMRRHRWRLMRP